MQDMNVITQVILPLSLAFIMFSLGLALVVDDFRRVFQQPRDFLIGFASQLFLLPTVAFMIATALSLDPVLSVGLMIIAACPGGVTSNLLTHLAKGDSALSVSLTAVTSLLSVITLPIVVGVGVAAFMGEDAPDIAVAKIAGGSFAIVAVPVLAGMAVRRCAPDFAMAFERIARHVATALFAIIIFGAIFSLRDEIARYFAEAGLAAIALNVVMMILAFAIARGARLGPRQQTAITMECGLQNGTLAIFVAVSLIGNEIMSIPGAVYSVIMYATAFAYLAVASRRPRAAHA